MDRHTTQFFQVDASAVLSSRTTEGPLQKTLERLEEMKVKHGPLSERWHTWEM